MDFTHLTHKNDNVYTNGYFNSDDLSNGQQSLGVALQNGFNSFNLNADTNSNGRKLLNSPNKSDNSSDDKQNENIKRDVIRQNTGGFYRFQRDGLNGVFDRGYIQQAAPSRNF